MPLPDMAPGAWLCLPVEDTVTGIATEHLPHIFDPFFTPQAPGTGTGLGLAQVYGSVKPHGGALDVTSRLLLFRYLCHNRQTAPAITYLP